MESILFIDQFNKIGGGQSVLIDLINAAEKNKLAITVALPNGGYVESKAPDNTKFIYLPNLNLTNGSKSIKDVFKLIFYYAKLLKLIRQIKVYDYIYVNGPRFFMFIYIISLFFKRKFIYHTHIDFSAFGKQLTKRIAISKNTYRVVFNSNYILKEYLTYSKMSVNNKLIVIEPTLSENYSALKFVNRFEDFNKPNYNFACIGRIIAEKGFDLYLEFAKQHPTHIFYIIGGQEDGEDEYYKSLVVKKTDNVMFLGKSIDIPELINVKHIHFSIVPSEWNEPFGIVAIEAMACSCITLVRNKGGLNEISINTGAVLFSDIADLDRAFHELNLSNNGELTKLANTQFQNTKENYSFGKLNNKFKELLLT